MHTNNGGFGMRARVKSLIVAGIAVGVLSAAGAATTATATVGAHGTGGFGAAPAHSDPADPATRAYFKPVLAPGATLTDEVQVTSTSNEAIRLIVSSVDGLTGQTSGAVYANRQDRVTKAGAWVTPATTSVTLAPHSQRLVGFTIKVPSTATPGDHLAGLAFEDSTPHTSGGQFGVTQIVRSVVGVDINVKGPAAPHIRLSGLGLAALPGLRFATVTINIGDDGRKLVKPLLNVSLTGPSGYHHTLARRLDTILPGDTIAYPFVWPDDLAAGDYTISVSATIGAEREVETATVHLGAALKGAKKPMQIVVASSTPIGTVPLLLFGGALLGMALFIGFRVGTRRQPRLAR